MRWCLSVVLESDSEFGQYFMDLHTIIYIISL